MLDLSKHKYLKYFLFGDIYFANGIQGSISMVILILYFSEKDISISTTTIVAGVASLPFVFKFIFGPVSDYYIKFGRKPFIIIGGLIGGFSLIIVAFIDPTKALIPFTFFLLLTILGIVFLDIAADAWAIQVTEFHERGKMNAAMATGLFGGMAVGNILLSIIAINYGFYMTFIVTGIVIIIASIFPLIIKEKIILEKHAKIIKNVVIEFKKKKQYL